MAELFPASRTDAFPTHATLAPFRSTAPRPYPGFDKPLRVRNLPPTTTLSPAGDIARAFTCELVPDGLAAVGAQLSKAPSLAWTAASRPRATPFIAANRPPR